MIVQSMSGPTKKAGLGNQQSEQLATQHFVISTAGGSYYHSEEVIHGKQHVFFVSCTIIPVHILEFICICI